MWGSFIARWRLGTFLPWLRMPTMLATCVPGLPGACALYACHDSRLRRWLLPAPENAPDHDMPPASESGGEAWWNPDALTHMLLLTPELASGPPVRVLSRGG